MSDVFSDFESEIIFVLPEFHPMDMYRKVGGFHTGEEISDEVDDLFQPGIILGSDASESQTEQYRKGFIKNVSERTLTSVKVYGFNTKGNNYIKFALEKDLTQLPKLDGSEVIKDYRTKPDFFGDYNFTEITDEVSAMLIGSGGVLNPSQGQGIWFRMALLKNVSDLASDEFKLGVTWDK